MEEENNTVIRGMEWRVIPGYPDYEVNIHGAVDGPDGRLEVETLMGSKAYILFRKDGAQFLVRPSELIQRAFPDISDEEAMRWDRVTRTSAMVRKDIVELEAYHAKRIRQLYEELNRVENTR
jgi:hypothetical protein